MSWLKNLNDLREKVGKNYKQIAEGTHQPERNIIRIFKGETENPTITTIIPIVNYLGGNLSEIFADTCAIVGSTNLSTLQQEKDSLQANYDLLLAEKNLLKTETDALNGRIELLEMKLMYTEKLLLVYEKFDKIKTE
jgi:transcriptional regulator with XRE-family HTH domain